MFKKIGIGILALLLIGVIYFKMSIYPKLPILNGYAAKKMCSCTFIADRSTTSITEEDLNFSPISMAQTSVNKEEKSVTATLYGLGKKKAVYKDDLGCILLKGDDDHDIELTLQRPTLSANVEWPLGDQVTLQEDYTAVDIDKLKTNIDQSFKPSDKTRAVIVIHKDKIIYERYAEGFDAHTEIQGWSMTKNITATQIGILIKKGILNLDDIHLLPEWQQDDRKNISLRHLLNMESGLIFEEDYGKICDVTNMLYQTEDLTQIPIDKPLAHTPGTYYYYNSGTTNILQRIIKNKLGSLDKYHHFAYEDLLFKIGMTSAVLETDEIGTFVGSSNGFATPRDWAKLGLLYLNEGNWNGEQILDSSWVSFASRPTTNSNGTYGGHFWTNKGNTRFPSAPESLYSMNGYQGQRVIILPEQDMIIVRMGMSDSPSFDHDGLLKGILNAIQ